MNTQLDRLIIQRDAARREDQRITAEMQALRKESVSEAKADRMEKKWQAVVVREKEANEEKRLLRFRLLKALMLLGYTNKKIARLCGISQNCLRGRKDALERLERRKGEWLDQSNKDIV